MSTVGILIIDDDEMSQAALRQVLDSDGWKVHIVPLANQAFSELATGDWTLVIANIAMTGLSGPLFSTLRDLALAPPIQDGRKRARVLFLIPELAGPEAQPALERDQVPYALKPFHLHDFLEKVGDLLLETESISAPIRRIRYEYKAADRREKDRRTGKERRATDMFAAREDYMMSEEEIAEFEKQEKEEQERKKKRKKEPWEV